MSTAYLSSPSPTRPPPYATACRAAAGRTPPLVASTRLRPTDLDPTVEIGSNPESNQLVPVKPKQLYRFCKKALDLLHFYNLVLSDSPGFYLASLVLMAESAESNRLTHVKPRSTWVITSKTSPMNPSEPLD
jgi:hypothetical protein